jgi:hypothetical protein
MTVIKTFSDENIMILHLMEPTSGDESINIFLNGKDFDNDDLLSTI